MADPLTEWRSFTDLRLAELLADTLAYAVAQAATRALTAQQAQIARLRAELDRYQGRTVYHCTDNMLDRLVIIDAQPGDILRATDTGRERVYHSEGGWEAGH